MASALAPDPSADFRSAMDALDRGDNREAATSFTVFLAKHSHDPRGEDAAYLCVIALQRCGDAGAMKEAAQDYLRRYPGGFRRAEVDPLSR
jgi:TolA-binding protein